MRGDLHLNGKISIDKTTPEWEIKHFGWFSVNNGLDWKELKRVVEKSCHFIIKQLFVNQLLIIPIITLWLGLLESHTQI